MRWSCRRTNCLEGLGTLILLLREYALLLEIEIYTVFYASLYCTRSCPGVLLAKKRIFKNAIPSCVGGGVVEHVSRDGAIWIEVSSVWSCIIGG